MPENVLCLNRSVGEKLNPRNGVTVEISSGHHTARIQVKLT
jgi:hypothetical protein